LARPSQRGFFREGARIALWDIDLPSAQSVASSLDPSGEKAIAVQVDITCESEIIASVDKVMKKFKRIDLLVNNAGISRHARIEEMTLELLKQ